MSNPAVSSEGHSGGVRQKALREELTALIGVVGPGPLVDLLLERAFQLKATDIHLDPPAEGLRVRLRVDGLLHDVLQLPIEMMSHVISRIKLMAGMGVWLGPMLTLRAFCVGAIFAGAIALVMIVAGRRLWQSYFNMSLIMTKLRSWKTAFSEFGSVRVLQSTSQLLPYGVPLSIGTLVVMFSQGASWWMF